MEFELREKEVFRILNKLRDFKDIVLIGGYALNSYVEFPRFSVDCDLIVYDEKEIIEILKKEGCKSIEQRKDFVRFERKVDDVKIGIDLLIKKLIDRQSGITFDLLDILKDSAIRELPSRSDAKLKIKFRIAGPEMLFVLKFASLRDQDIRDIFILSTYDLNRDKIKEFVKKYFSNELQEDRIKKLKESIESKNFIDSLQGVHGKLPEEFIARNKKRLLSFVLI
jgi:hypothetical protein